MIIKAKVTSNSSEDVKGRVHITTPNVWDAPILTPVVGCMPLNVGDIVFVEVDDTYMNPLVIGKAFDDNFITNATQGGDGYATLYESVAEDGWSVEYVKGSHNRTETSEGGSIDLNGDIVSLNDGSNGGMVNVRVLRKMVEAVYRDLLTAGSGTQLSQWMGTSMGVGADAIEDEKSKH